MWDLCVFLLQGRLALLSPRPALTLNSLGTVSFGVARPRKASRPQPRRMARTEEKSLSTLRIWPHSGHSVRFRPAIPLLLHPFPFADRTQGQELVLSHRKRGDTHHGGEEAACLYMLQGHGKEERGKEEEERQEGYVWGCMTARATRVASPPGTLRWR